MNKKQLKTVIIVCWILLAICFVIKIFGGNWFELSSDNEKFVQFCTFVDNTMWLKMILACVIYCISGYFIMCISINTNKLTRKQLLIIFPIMVLKSIISWYFYWAAFVLDIFILIVLPTIFSKKILRSIICFAAIMAFQVISLIIRNIGINNFNDGMFLVQTLIQIDYYIMIALLYFYNFKFLKEKEVS